MKTRKYDAQSLALVMVLLIVGAVIVFALYTRSVREQERLVGERASAEANEIAETAAGIIGSSDYNKVGEVFTHELDDCDDFGVGCNQENISMEDFAEILDELHDYIDVSEELRELGEIGEVEDYCTADISIRYGTERDDVGIERDEVYSLFLKPENPSGCEIDFEMRPVDNPEGFIMSTFSKDGGPGEKYLPYDRGDIQGYQYDGDSGNWKEHAPETGLIKLPEDMPQDRDVVNIYEIRFKSLGGLSRLSWDASDACELKDIFLIQVGATCGDRYVGKEFAMPSEPFAPPIFDYVLFNGAGELRPERIAE